jgi:hypothetical protein
MCGDPGRQLHGFLCRQDRRGARSQHLRDLTDVRDLLAKEGVEEVFRKAFIIYLSAITG